MDNEWVFFPCSIEDKTAFVLVDMSVAETIDVDGPEYLAKLRLEYKRPHPNGLPTDAEFEPVRDVGEAIERYASDGGDSYVGRVTVDGRRSYYVYTHRDQSSWSEFVEQLSSRSGYDLSLSYSEDPEHAGYHEDLYPTADDWQVIKDLGVIEVLEEHGDDGSAPRKVDHWIYFDSKEASTDFVKWAKSDGFTEEREYSGTSDDGRYCVRLAHHGTVQIADITSRTIALRRKAEDFGGEYDGWETVVVKSEGR